MLSHIHLYKPSFHLFPHPESITTSLRKHERDKSSQKQKKMKTRRTNLNHEMTGGVTIQIEMRGMATVEATLTKKKEQGEKY